MGFYELLLNGVNRSTALKRARLEFVSLAQGKCLEIGIGTGVNLSYYPESATVTAEPDLSLQQENLLKRYGRPIQILQGSAEKLPFQAEAFDSVVATLVLCTISNANAAMDEMHRVLKPGGRLILIEHVKSQSAFLATLQNILTPLWKYFARGCHLNRNPIDHLGRHSFTLEKEHLFWGGIGKAWLFRK
jgi:ubiquinone/menaquinone biosynthesis C-methylase UbiE